MTLKRNSEEWHVYQYIINDYEMYSWLMTGWKKNYYRKMKRGKYQRELAIKGLRDNFVPTCLTKLRKTDMIEKYRRFTKTEKHAIANELVRDIEEEIDYEYDMLATTSNRIKKTLGM